MYFISDKGMRVTVRSARKLYTPQGDVMGTEKRLFAIFTRGGHPEWLLREAIERLPMRGLPSNMHPHQRVWVFDSEAAQLEWKWSDDEREIVENFLLGRIRNGETSDFQLIEEAAPPIPFPSYDEYVAKTDSAAARTNAARNIAKIVKQAGVDPTLAIEYEVFNLNREEVVEALNELVGTETTYDPEMEVVG